ncbi:MAG: hypothetical protein SXV54_09330 [Chloroflexota bacterium]|nr:hypothetical protein [Chloroflexota bacterium]
MNIQGFKFLEAYGFPIPRFNMVFRSPEELDWATIAEHGVVSGFLMVAFDDRSSIYDHPYKNRGIKAIGISAEQIMSTWRHLSRELFLMGVDKRNQIYLLLEQFTEEMIKFSGMADKIVDTNWFGRVAIDIVYGSRPVGRDWRPDYSMSLPIIAGRPFWSQVEICTSKGNEHPTSYIISRLVRDLRRIPQNVHLDFEVMTNGYFLYHDLFFIGPVPAV